MNEIVKKESVIELLDSMEIPFDDNLVDRLSHGLESQKIDNIRTGENEYQDGIIKIFKNKEGIAKIDFNPVYPQLDIPLKIFGHKLKPEEVVELENHGEIIIADDYNPLHIKIDKELNEVIVKGEKELKAVDLKEIGGLKLTQKEIDKLQKGEEVGPKVLYDKETDQYIQSTFSLTKDQTGFVFSPVKELTKEKALELIPKLNEQPTITESLSNIGQEKLSNIQESKSDIIELIANKDYQGLQNHVDEQESKISTEELQIIYSSPSYQKLSTAEKQGMDIILDSSPLQVSKMLSPGELDKTLTNDIEIKDLKSLTASKEFSKADIEKLSKFTESVKDTLEPKKLEELKKITEKVVQNEGKVFDKSNHSRSIGVPSRSKSLKM